MRPPLAPDGLPTGMPDAYDIPTLGWGVLAWAEEFLAQPDGLHAGDPWRWTSTQARLVAWWYSVDKSGRWLFRRGQVVLPKGSGKALALDTPIPTPTGWTTMGTLRPGDLVFDENGNPTRVLAATDVMHGRPCYRVSFNDGSSIVADAEHEWPMDRFVGDAKRRRTICTTREMSELGVKYRRPLTTGRTKASNPDVSRWRTLQTPALPGAHVDLPLPAYTLGYWLGDGDSDQPRLTVGAEDYEHLVLALKRDDVITGEPQRHRGRTALRVRFGMGRRADSVYALRELGVLNDKHVPDCVLRAGDRQRREVLAGLIDSDGHVSASSGACSIDLMNEKLARSVAKLIRSLGVLVKVRPAPAAIYGRVVGTRYRMSFTLRQGEVPLRLPRKAERLRPPVRQIPFSSVRVVTAVEPVEPVPVRCIQVGAGSSLYLAGDGMVPTHNSPLAAALCCCELGAETVFDGFDAHGDVVGRPHPSPHVQLAAVSESATDNTMSLVLPMLAEGPAANAIPGLDIGRTRVLTRNGKLEPVTASAASREGQRATAAILDEPHLMIDSNGGKRLAAVIRRNLGKMNGRSLETTNAWMPGQDSVAELTALYADKIAEQRAGGPQKVLDEGVMRYHPKALVPNLSDIPVLRAGLEGLYRDAPWVDIDRLIAEVLDPGTHPADARRFYLNAVVTADDALVSAEEWELCYHDDVLSAGEEITLGFDGSKNDDSTVLVAMRISDRFATVIGAMEKPDQSGRDWEVDREFFDGLVANCFAQYRVVGFFSDVAHFESYVDKWHSEYAGGLKVHATPKNSVGWDMRGRLQLNTRATENLVAAIRDGKLRHDGGSLLRRHVLAAKRRPNAYGVSFGKSSRDSAYKVDAFAALQLSDMARTEYVGAASKVRQRTGRVW